MPLVDTHAHLDQEEFDADRAAVIKRAAAAGVERILCVGVDANSSAAAIRLAEEFSQVYAAVGIHPNSAAAATPDDWNRILGLLDHPRAVAVGETGLDRHWEDVPFDLQQAYFERHLRLSRERDLPVIIHCRDAWEDLLPMLRSAAAQGPLGGVMHAMSGDAAMAAECVALGLHISFAGNVTYRNKKFESLRAAVASVPMDRLLVETDSPYLTPEPLRGNPRRNEPANIVHTAKFLAQLLGQSQEAFDLQTAENARRLFNLS
jgi:TatD DNase family protein